MNVYNLLHSRVYKGSRSRDTHLLLFAKTHQDAVLIFRHVIKDVTAEPSVHLIPSIQDDDYTSREGYFDSDPEDVTLNVAEMSQCEFVPLSVRRLKLNSLQL